LRSSTMTNRSEQRSSSRSVRWDIARAGLHPRKSFSRRARKNSCDCVITDIHMPGMSGLDLQRQLMVRDWQVPVIMITARGEPGLEARVAASGAICLLKKPFGADALVGCLEKALEI